MIRSPRQAPAGACASPDASAHADAAHRQQHAERLARAQCLDAERAPVTMVISGRVESASVPRATVV